MFCCCRCSGKRYKHYKWSRNWTGSLVTMEELEVIRIIIKEVTEVRDTQTGEWSERRGE